VAAGLAAVVTVQGCGEDGATVSRLDEIADAVPRSVAGWHVEEPDRLFDARSIFDYIDGHAEVYLAYSMRRCLARRYAGPDSEVVLDVFEMASAGDAFGVFTHDLDGEEVGIGQDSRFRYGWLSFWKGPFFVSIVTDGEDAAAERVVLELGRAVAAAVPETGARPPLVRALPAEGLDTSSVRYLHHPQILSAHTAIPLDDPLGIGTTTPAVIAHYERAGGSAEVLVVSYPEDARAAEALVGAERLLSREPDQVHGMRLAGRTLVLVLRADDEHIAAEMLDIAAAVDDKEPS
jgi:hypothetical protein